MATLDGAVDFAKNAIGWQQGADTYTIIMAMGEQIPAFIQLTGAVAYCMGIFFAWSAITKLYNAGTQPNGNEKPSDAIIVIFLAACLFYLPSFLNSMSVTVFGDGVTSVFSYIPKEDMEQKFNDMRRVLFYFIYMVGIMAVVRGIMIFKSATEGKNDASVGKGMIHLLGGVAAMHLDKLGQAFSMG